MQILWNKNPVYTNTICDERDKLIIERELIREKARFGLVGVKYYLEEDNKVDALRIAKQYLESIDEDNIQERVDEFVEELAKGRHGGDCMCWPCTCDLCYAESLLGFSSIQDFSKHTLYKIDDAFADENTTFAEALEYLENYNPPMKPEYGWTDEASYMSHMPRWQEEARLAAKQLRTYKEKHFPEAK